MIARIVCVLLFAGVIGISVWMIRDAILWVRDAPSRKERD